MFSAFDYKRFKLFNFLYIVALKILDFYKRLNPVSKFLFLQYILFEIKIILQNFIDNQKKTQVSSFYKSKYKK